MPEKNLSSLDEAHYRRLGRQYPGYGTPVMTVVQFGGQVLDGLVAEAAVENVEPVTVIEEALQQRFTLRTPIAGHVHLRCFPPAPETPTSALIGLNTNERAAKDLMSALHEQATEDGTNYVSVLVSTIGIHLGLQDAPVKPEQELAQVIQFPGNK